MSKQEQEKSNFVKPFAPIAETALDTTKDYVYKSLTNGPSASFQSTTAKIILRSALKVK